MSIRARLTRRMVRRLLDDGGNNPTDLARLLGVTRPTIYAWRDGQPAQGANLRRLADLAGVALPDNSEQIDVLTGRRVTWDGFHLLPSLPKLQELADE